jgi:hypothetical protein
MDIFIDDEDDNQLDDGDVGVGGGVDVIAVGLDAFTSALIERESCNFEMAHYINDYPIIFDRFNELLGVLFEMELTPSTKRLVTTEHIVNCMFDHEKYSFAVIISTSHEGIKNKQRKDHSEERGKIHLSAATAVPVHSRSICY